MNVYDFDDTIFDGDSTVQFFLYCLRRCPRMWLDVPAQAVNAALFLLKLRKKQPFKERMFGFLRCVKDIDAMLDAFWDSRIGRVKAFYRQIQCPDDVVISASPEFLVRPACERLGIRHVMASPVDKHTGKYSGLNCHGEEKVVCFRARFGEAPIRAFYSDSLSDAPLARLSREAFLVKGETLLPWPKGK